MTQAFNLAQLANNLNTTGQLDASDGVYGALPIANGGTGQTTANAALNALLPTQSGNSGKYLSTDGSNTSWANAPTGITTTTGSAPYYACRAFVNFNGQGTVAIRNSYNVSSISDNGTGWYTVNFSTAMADVNYSDMCGGGKWTDSVDFGGYTQVPYTLQSGHATTGAQIYVANPTQGNNTDPAYVSYVVFR